MSQFWAHFTCYLIAQLKCNTIIKFSFPNRHHHSFHHPWPVSRPPQDPGEISRPPGLAACTCKICCTNIYSEKCDHIKNPQVKSLVPGKYEEYFSTPTWQGIENNSNINNFIKNNEFIKNNNVKSQNGIKMPSENHLTSASSGFPADGLQSVPPPPP